MRKRTLPVLALALALTVAACGAQPDARPGRGAAETDRGPAAGGPTAPEPAPGPAPAEPAPAAGGNPAADPDEPVVSVPDSGAAAPGAEPAPAVGEPVTARPAPEPAPGPVPAQPAPAPDGDAAQPAPVAQGPLAFETLVGGSYSGFTRPTQLLVGDAATLRSAWQQYGARMVPAPELPPVDFSRESVVVVALGERNTGGYSFRVTGVRREDSKLVVTVATSQPGPGDMVTMAFTQPFHIIKIPVPAAGLELEVQGMPAGSGKQGAADR